MMGHEQAIACGPLERLGRFQTDKRWHSSLVTFVRQLVQLRSLRHEVPADRPIADTVQTQRREKAVAEHRVGDARRHLDELLSFAEGDLVGAVRQLRQAARLCLETNAPLACAEARRSLARLLLWRRSSPSRAC
jgi:hypothetical protein